LKLTQMNLINNKMKMLRLMSLNRKMIMMSNKMIMINKMRILILFKVKINLLLARSCY